MNAPTSDHRRFFRPFMVAILKSLAFHQWPTGNARALGMTPHQFLRIRVPSIDGQEVQCQLASRAGHIALHHLLLVCRQAIRRGAPLPLSLQSVVMRPSASAGLTMRMP